MRINKINNQYFGNKKFRLPVNEINYHVHGILLWSEKPYAVREYSNPKAEQLYKQARVTRDIKEAAKLYKEMGHYEIKEMNFIEKIKSFFHIW